MGSGSGTGTPVAPSDQPVATQLIIEWHVFANSGSISPTSVKLCSPDGTWGVRRTDTLGVVVAADTSMTAAGGGVYRYTVPQPAENLEYEYYIKVSETTENDNVFYIHGHATGTPASDNPNTLAGIRRLVVDLSGRVDLVRNAVEGDYADMGKANITINAAQKWLDRRLKNHKSRAVLYKTLAAGESMITFTRARSPKAVYEQDADGYRTSIEWAVMQIGLAPDQKEATAESLPEAADYVIYGNHWAHKAIYVEPDDENSRTIAIEADWYCPTLTADGDQSFWTIEEPMLLVYATMLQLEVPMRNTQGVADFGSYIEDDVKKIYHDLIDEETAGPPSRWRMR